MGELREDMSGSETVEAKGEGHREVAGSEGYIRQDRGGHTRTLSSDAMGSQCLILWFTKLFQTLCAERVEAGQEWKEDERGGPRSSVRTVVVLSWEAAGGMPSRCQGRGDGLEQRLPFPQGTCR